MHAAIAAVGKAEPSLPTGTCGTKKCQQHGNSSAPHAGAASFRALATRSQCCSLSYKHRELGPIWLICSLLAKENGHLAVAEETARNANRVHLLAQKGRKVPPCTCMPHRSIEYPTLVPYLLAFGLSCVPFALLILFVGNNEIFLFVNAHSNSYTDVFFSWLTLLGTGAAFLVEALLVLGLDYAQDKGKLLNITTGYRGYVGTAWWRRGVCLLVGFALSSGLAQGLKRTFFSDSLRPKAVFEALQIPIRLPEGVDVHSLHSFPSGHTVTIFCMACFLAFFAPKPKWQLFHLGLAWLVGFSRIFLSQHFPFDVLGGAVVGTVCALLVRSWFFPRQHIYLPNPKFNRNSAASNAPS